MINKNKNDLAVMFSIIEQWSESKKKKIFFSFPFFVFFFLNNSCSSQNRFRRKSQAGSDSRADGERKGIYERYGGGSTGKYEKKINKIKREFNFY